MPVLRLDVVDESLGVFVSDERGICNCDCDIVSDVTFKENQKYVSHVETVTVIVATTSSRKLKECVGRSLCHIPWWWSS